MKLNRTAIVAVALLLVVSASGGAVGSISSTDTGTNTLSGTQSISTASTVVNLSYKVTQENPVGKTVKLKSVTGSGNNPAANWTITAPNGTEVLNVTGVSTPSFVPEQPGNFTVSISKNDTTTTYDGETSNLSIDRQTASLKIKNRNISATQVGDTAEYKVGTGNAALAGVNVTVSYNGSDAVRTWMSNENGIVNATYFSNGTANLSVTKATTNTTRFLAYNESKEIVYESEKLVIGNTNGTADELGDSIEFTIEDGSADPESNVTVTVDNETLRTDENGVVNVTFTQNKSYSLAFTKNITNNTRYEPVVYNTTVTLKGLVLDINATEPIRPGTIAYDLDDTDSHSVANATIRFGNESLLTDEEGQANTTVNYTEQGVYNLTVTKDRYETIRRNLTVDAVGKELNVTANRTAASPGEPIRFNVTNNGTGVSNATVSVLNRTFETTDGTVNVTVDEPGNHTVNVTKSGYEYRTRNVTINDPLVEVRFDGVASTADNTTRFANLTLTDAPNGLTGYDIVLTLSNNSTARFNATASAYSDAFGIRENVTVSNGGANVTFEAADLEGSVSAGEESITLATVAIDGLEAGSLNLSVEPQRIDGNNRSIDARTNGSTFTVVDAPNLHNDTQVRDNDHDGTYEDVNANGQTDYDDVVTMFDQRESTGVQSSVSLFDYTDSGDVGFYDIVALYEESQAAS